MQIKEDTLKYLAHLGRIELEAQESKVLSGQLKDILDFIDQLKRADIKDVSATSHILSINNVLRDDSSRESLTRDQALENAPVKEGNFFGVPKVIE